MQHEHIRERLNKLGIRGGDFAALVGVSQPKMSGFLRGRSGFDAVRVKEIVMTVADLEKFKTIFPIPLGVHDPKLLAVALERLRNGRFDEFADVMKQSDWTTIPEHMEKKYPKIFKQNEDKQWTYILSASPLKLTD